MFTLPNLISLARGAGVPLFLWTYLALDAKGWALIILMAGGASDYLDGKLARALGQESALGAKLDPAIDRLYLGAILIAFAIKDVLCINIRVSSIIFSWSPKISNRQKDDIVQYMPKSLKLPPRVPHCIF